MQNENTDQAALLEIQQLMDGVEWSATTLHDIAQVMVKAGYRIRDLEDKALEDLSLPSGNMVELATTKHNVRAGGDHVRDVSVHPDIIRQAANHRHYAPAPDEGDYGGAFDGNQVISDADPGL